MNWTALSKPLLRLGLQVALAVGAYWLFGRFGEFTRQDAEGLSTLIQLIGSLYAVVFAFVIFVIWGQFNDVENFVMRECNSLNDLLRFSRSKSLVGLPLVLSGSKRAGVPDSLRSEQLRRPIYDSLVV